MSQEDLVADLTSMLKDAVTKFSAAGVLERILDYAALDLGRVRARVRFGSITVVSGQEEYAPPADFLRPGLMHWGHEKRKERNPWDSNWPKKIPDFDSIETDTGLAILITPAPTAEQVADFGATCKFRYYAAHVIDADAAKTSVKKEDRHLLLIRAVAQVLSELALDGISKPVQLGPGVGSMPKNGMPAALADQYLKAFERMAA